MPKKVEPPADPFRFEEAIDAFRRRVPMTRAEWDELAEAQKEKAFMVSEVATADLVTEVFEAIDRAIEHGTTIEEFKATAGETLIDHWGEEKPGRLETIFRTNVMANYNAGRHAMITAPAVLELRPYVRYDGIDDDRQTEFCRALDGKILPADDPLWNRCTPPNHYNCRCVLTPLSEEEAEEEGIETEPPDVEPQDGFGLPPSAAGQDWTPEMIGYPKEVKVELQRRLAAGRKRNA